MTVSVTHTKTLVSPDSGSDDKIYGVDYVSTVSHSVAGLATVAESGAYGDLSGAPTLGTVASTNASDYALSTHFHSAASVTTGVFDTARIAAGSANVSTFPDGTGNWSIPVYGSLAGLPTLGTVASTAAALYALSSEAHIANYITSSTFALARIAGGTYNTSTYLSGTSTFNQPSFSSLANLPTLGTAASTNVGNYASSTHNISSATHTFPGNTSTFLRADGTFTAPSASAAWGSITGTLSDQTDISTLYTLNTDLTTYMLASRISSVYLSTIRNTTTTSSLPLTELAFSVSNTIRYSFEFGVVYASAISSTGLRLGLQFPATSSFAASVEIPTIVATGTDSRTQGYIIATGSSVVSPSTPLASTQYFATVFGSILPSANGTLQLCYGTEVAGSAISTFAASYGTLTAL